MPSGRIAVRPIRVALLSMSLRSDLTESRRVVAAAIVVDGKVLLCHRHPDRRWYPDVWDPPGGHLDDSEAADAALVREISEELGVVVDIPTRDPPRILNVDGEFEPSLWVVIEWKGEVTNNAPEEHDAISWFSAEEIPYLKIAHPDIEELCLSLLLNEGQIQALK